MVHGFNPYFTGLPILITMKMCLIIPENNCFNPYFTGLPILISKDLSTLIQKLLEVSILILLDYLFLSVDEEEDE